MILAKTCRTCNYTRLGSCLATLVVCLAAGAPAAAQFKDSEPDGQKLGKTDVMRWRGGMIIRASGGACHGLAGYVAVPMDWPEQEVQIVKEEVSSGVKISYETIDAGVRIMNVRLAQLPAGQEAKAIVTVEIRRRATLPPKDTDIYVLPDVKKLSSGVRRYLQPSPEIESRDPKIRDLAKQIGADKEKAWDHVEAIYDWVRKKVKYKNGPLKGAVAALKDGTGDCKELTSLFIAICRAADIPARTVHVYGHAYPEFYLCDDQGKGHWFPCQAAGTREFGGMTDLRPILAKGDNFRPKNSKKRQHFLAESLVGAPSPGGGQPQVQWIRQILPK